MFDQPEDENDGQDWEDSNEGWDEWCDEFGGNLLTLFNVEYINAKEHGMCGCGDEHIWYDSELGCYRCRNCGWEDI